MGSRRAGFFQRPAQGFAPLPLTALNFFSETMPRNDAIIFGDLLGKLDMLHVACDKCARKGRYAVARLIEQHGSDAKVVDFLAELKAGCPKKQAGISFLIFFI
jgi:hypothetical protein